MLPCVWYFFGVESVWETVGLDKCASLCVSVFLHYKAIIILRMPSGQGEPIVPVPPDTDSPQSWQGPPAPASLANSDVTTGRVPCLNQSNDFASLDLSVLFFILPVNTSASTGPPNRTWWAFVLWCFAMQPCKGQTPDHTKGSLPPPPPPPLPSP